VEDYVCQFACTANEKGQKRVVSTGAASLREVISSFIPSEVDEYQDKAGAYANLAFGGRDEFTRQLDAYLEDKPLTGPRGQQIDVAVGGEYDVLTDIVRTGHNSSEQIFWVRLDGGEKGKQGEEAEGESALLTILNGIPEGRGIGITQREDHMMNPMAMGMTGKSTHPPDVPYPGEPGGRRFEWATYPEDTLFIPLSDGLTMEDAIEQGLVTTPGARQDPLLNKHLKHTETPEIK